jgi:hypothetical protein
VHTDNSDRIEIIAVGAFGWQSCPLTKTVVFVLRHALWSYLRIRLAPQAENLAQRHPISALQRGRKRLPLNAANRFLWACRSRLWVGWCSGTRSRSAAGMGSCH